MIDIEKLKFDEKGLIPAIVVDATTKKVLTLAYMNKESLAISMEKELTCFHNPVFQSENRHEFSYESLMEMLIGRKVEKKEGSYTTYLFEKGLDKILKKVGEECTEVIIAAKDDDKAETIYEVADLCYHVMVMMIQMGISLEDIHKELASRHVIDHKVKQEKMTGK